MSGDPYKVLGLSRGATPDQVRKAYRELAKRYHPDHNPGDTAAEERFKEISVAYEILSNPEKRALYDEFGLEGVRQGFDPEAARAWRRVAGGRGGRGRGRGGRGIEFGDMEGFGLDDLFSEMFGGGFSVRDFGQKRGQDHETVVEIDLPEALRGAEATIRATRSTVRLTIPPHVEDGQVLRVQGQGGKAPRGGQPGDLHVRIRVRPHPHLRREEGGAVLDVPVTVSEAVKGGKIRIPTLDGQVDLKVPPGSQTGTRLRVRGKGGGGKDLIVNLVVMVPTQGGDRLREAAESLDEHYAGDVREKLEL